MTDTLKDKLAKKKFLKEGEVSYYDDKSVDPRYGGITKSGEKFDETKMTMAVLPEDYKELKGKTVKVTNIQTNKSVDVKVNDTGGFKKYGRQGDLSKGAFSQIEDTKKGTLKARIELLDTEENKGEKTDALQKGKEKKVEKVKK